MIYKKNKSTFFNIILTIWKEVDHTGFCKRKKIENQQHEKEKRKRKKKGNVFKREGPLLPWNFLKN